MGVKIAGHWMGEALFGECPFKPKVLAFEPLHAHLVAGSRQLTNKKTCEVAGFFRIISHYGFFSR
jgi:hypothetical protein